MESSHVTLNCASVIKKAKEALCLSFWGQYDVTRESSRTSTIRQWVGWPPRGRTHEVSSWWRWWVPTVAPGQLCWTRRRRGSRPCWLSAQWCSQECSCQICALFQQFQAWCRLPSTQPIGWGKKIEAWFWWCISSYHCDFIFHHEIQNVEFFPRGILITDAHPLCHPGRSNNGGVVTWWRKIHKTPSSFYFCLRKLYITVKRLWIIVPNYFKLL